MKTPGFWRGFFPLLATLSIAPASAQIDIALIAGLGTGAPAAYALITRIALFDAALVAGVGAVASVAVAKAGDASERARIIGYLWAIAAVAGVVASAVGFVAYPALLRLVGAAEVSDLARAALLWHLAAIPFRILSGVGLFVLFSIELGRLALGWKFFETVAKAVLTYYLIYPFGFGFAGCFAAGLLTSIAGAVAIFTLVWVRSKHAPAIPPWSATRDIVVDAICEAARILSPQLLVLASFALFAAPWIGRYEPARVDCYAAGQTLILLALTPFAALTRFLAIRLTDAPAESVPHLMRQGLPIAVAAAILLLLNGERLGAVVYHSEGRWWSTFVAALAFSLPIRFVANVLRGALQAGGRFLDAAAPGVFTAVCVALPLTALGLYLDIPAVAYLAIVAPEAVCAMLLWSRLAGTQAVRRAAFQI